MRVCAVAGGVGSARFCAGLVQVIDPSDLTIVVNTADDERIRGLHVSPDIDTVLYHLTGSSPWDRGWGIADETYAADERYKELAAASDVPVDLQEWFALGDRDLATHMFRSRLLDGGRTLSEATDALRLALGVKAGVKPMSDEPVRTRLLTKSGESLDFQTYFVRRGHADEIASVSFDGASGSHPAPGVLDAIASADIVIIPPSNPIVSIGPVLAVPGIRESLASSNATRVAVSPIIGGKALKGPAGELMRSLGHAQDAPGVARIYEGLLDAFVLDGADAELADAVEALGIRAIVCDTIMSSRDTAGVVAKNVLSHV